MADAPHLGSLRPGRWLGVLLYLLLGVAAGMALLGGPRRVGEVWVDRAGVTAFGVFLLVFAIYRGVLVRAGRYSLGKGLYQVGAGLMLLIVLGYGIAGSPAPVLNGGDVGLLLSQPDANLRRVGCELARFRGERSAVELIRARQDDPAPEVAAECRRTLEALGGTKPSAPAGN